MGIIYFTSNFSYSLPLFHDEKFKDFTEGSIQVHLDQTDLQKTTSIQKEIFDNFRNFMKRIMKDCGKSEKLFTTPINPEVLFGKFDFDMKKSVGFGFFLL